jgi:hypothetical protein
MRKTASVILLLSLLLATAAIFGTHAQTRPRRVGQNSQPAPQSPPQTTPTPTTQKRPVLQSGTTI